MLVGLKAKLVLLFVATNRELARAKQRNLVGFTFYYLLFGKLTHNVKTFT
jgi:hypothetical protein